MSRCCKMRVMNDDDDDYDKLSIGYKNEVLLKLLNPEINTSEKITLNISNGLTDFQEVMLPQKAAYNVIIRQYKNRIQS